MGVLVREISDVAELVRRAATSPSDVFSHINPSTYNATDPLPLWVIQVVVIVSFTQLLALFLGHIRQPRVIAEVIGGILLGPSVMGRIPNFTNRVFPNASIPVLTLTSDIGLILFLFLVGVEIDVSVMRRNAKASIAVSIAGLVIPLGLGAAIAVPIYHTFTDKTVNFGYFILFVAVAVGITAFPVLCRILTELKLLDTTVGVTVLAAGVGNDIVGWVLLALTVALVNASKGITALWILLSAVAYILFLTLPVRWLYRWVGRRTGSLQSGQPSLLMMTFTIIIILISAFYTDIIGIHPIFGGFLAGLIIPHDNGYAIALVEKIEDLVSVLLLPLYFTLSGLRTDLGLLNNGITWGYTILICVVSFFSKFLGCAISAKLTGFNIRESGAIGSLMACKGLVELIALNIGYQAGILNERVFSMFVLHALVTTVVTTPLVLFFYPEHVRVRVNTTINAVGIHKSLQNDTDVREGLWQETFKTRITLVLDKMEQLPAAMVLAELLHIPPAAHSVAASHPSQTESDLKESVEDALRPTTTAPPPVVIDALRLVELTDRTSAVLKSQEVDYLLRQDPILNVFRTFGHLHHMSLSTGISVVAPEDFPSYIASYARETSSQMVIVPWNSAITLGSESAEAAGSSAGSTFSDGDIAWQNTWSSTSMQTNYIRKVFVGSAVDVGLFLDQSYLEAADGQRHIFLPFFGGADDRLALIFVAQLCSRDAVTATVLRMRKPTTGELERDDLSADVKIKQLDSDVPELAYATSPDTLYDTDNTQTRLESDTADDILWSRYTSSQTELSRIAFVVQTSERSLHTVLEGAKTATSNGSRVLLVTGRSRNTSAAAHDKELRDICTEQGNNFNIELPKTVGHVAAAFVVEKVRASLLVLQKCRQTR